MRWIPRIPVRDGPSLVGHSPHGQNPTHASLNRPLDPIMIDSDLNLKIFFDPCY